jgi:hypothetical protein
MQRTCAFLAINHLQTPVSGNSPKLWLPPCDPVDEHVLRLPQCQADGSPGHVRSVLVDIVPLLAVAEEEGFPMPSDGEGISPQSEGSASLRIGNADGVSSPVIDVIIPRKLAFYADITVLQVQDIHHFGDGVVAFGDFDLPILPALLERVHDRATIIFAARGGDGAKGASFIHAGQSWHGEERDQ